MTQQIVNRLLEYSSYRKPTTPDGYIDLDDENFATYRKEVIANGNCLDLPPFFIKRFDNQKQVVHCEGFTVSVKYVFF